MIETNSELGVTVAELERRVGELERTIGDLRAEVRDARGACGRASCASETADVGLSDIVAITEEIFGTPEVSVQCDPEDHETTFVVFTVRCRGECAEIVDKRIEWHERVSSVPHNGSGRFRLSIVPVP